MSDDGERGAVGHLRMKTSCERTRENAQWSRPGGYVLHDGDGRDGYAFARNESAIE